MKASQLFQFPVSLPFQDFFWSEVPPWQWVSKIPEALANFEFAAVLGQTEYPPHVHVGRAVYIHPSVKLPPYCVIEGPAYIGADTQIRPGAYLRSNVIVGQGCILGHACEYKNCLLMDKVETSHYNYVGDSILGTGTHLGAGVVLANLRLKRDAVHVYTSEGRVPTGLHKLGAMMGEYAEVGCNGVLQPGTILGRRSLVMPAMAFGGYLPDDTIVRTVSEINTVSRSD